MDYQKRLLKELASGYKNLTAYDFASIWKRSKVDVWYAALQLKVAGKIKISKEGYLSAR